MLTSQQNFLDRHFDRLTRIAIEREKLKVEKAKQMAEERAKAVDGLIDIGVNSLNETLWGNYYRDKEVEQSQRLLDQQTEAQSKLMKQSKDQQLAMWNATNYGAQVSHLEEAGLNPALMYGADGGGGSTTAGSGAGGQATASGAGKQQLLHDRTRPIDIANITVAAAQAKKLEAEAKT